MADDGGQRLTIVGVLASLGLIGALVCMGAGVLLMPGGGDEAPAPAAVTEAATTTEAATGDLGLIAHETEVPRLDPAAPYVPKDNVVEIELSEYAGYAGLIAANGGLAPNPESVFAKKFGFQVKLTISEADAWSPLNAGRIGASATTADVLPLYGRQFEVVVPAQIGFSRGADGIVVDKEIHRLNDLRGKVLVSGQFSEAEFFVRYLAQEAGIPVKVADEPVPADSDSITLVFAEDAFAAGDAYLADSKGANQLAGCVTWDPKTTEVVDASGGGAKVLVTNRNLLVVADVLVVNKGFAEQNPKMVRGLVEGIVEGNSAVRKDPAAHVATVAKAFGWTEAEAKAELSKVHLSNLPENLAFFGGEIDMAGSFGGIYQSSVYAYGRDIVKQPVGPERFVLTDALTAIQKDGLFADQAVEIAPIKVTGAGSIEDDPLLSKDIRFFFQPNSSDLDMKSKENLDNLAAIKRLLQVSPGSTILLRGHVDGARQEEFRKQGGEKFVREMALKAVQLSTERATEVEKQLVAIEKADDKRVEVVGVGWDEPVDQTDVDKNRRVEVQWFTIE